jgi:hypothetical protein
VSARIVAARVKLATEMMSLKWTYGYFLVYRHDRRNLRHPLLAISLKRLGLISRDVG